MPCISSADLSRYVRVMEFAVSCYHKPVVTNKCGIIESMDKKIALSRSFFKMCWFCFTEWFLHAVPKTDYSINVSKRSVGVWKMMVGRYSDGVLFLLELNFLSGSWNSSIHSFVVGSLHLDVFQSRSGNSK